MNDKSGDLAGHDNKIYIRILKTFQSNPCNMFLGKIMFEN